MIIYYGREFEKELKKLKKSNPKKYSTVLKKIKFFSLNPDHPSLRLHRLSGNWKDYFSFSVASNLRIIFSWKGEDEVMFYKLGTHDQVYRRN